MDLIEVPERNGQSSLLGFVQIRRGECSSAPTLPDTFGSRYACPAACPPGSPCLDGFTLPAGIDTGSAGARFHYKSPWSSINVAMRSTDSGETWGVPVLMDSNPNLGSGYLIAMNAKQGCEVSAVSVDRGASASAPAAVIGFIRPILSPVMWEARSTDQGRSWLPLARGAFPLYDTTATVTRSGVLLIAGRTPGGHGIQASWDGGNSYRLFTVDVPPGGGPLREIAPDLIIVMYVGFPGRLVRYMLGRVGHDPPSLTPVPPKEWSERSQKADVVNASSVW